MRISVTEIAAAVEGQVIGDPNRTVTGLAGLTEAGPNDLSFLANPRYAVHLPTTKAGAVLVAQEASDCPTVQIVVGNPDLAFSRLIDAFGPKPWRPATGVHPTAVLGDGVRLGAKVAIGAQVVIGDGAELGDGTVVHANCVIGADAVIGADCWLWPNVVVRERCRLGQRVILQPGAVVGADGFGFVLVNGKHQKSPQVGIVTIGDDVEVGANTTIDRARFGITSIGHGTKIDNLVQVAHNVDVGAHCLLVAQVGIAGSTRIGNYVTLAGQVGLAGHLTVGDQASVTAQSGVSKSVPPKTVVRGSPAREYKDAMAQEIALRRLPAALEHIKQLEARLKELERRLQERA